MPMSEIPRDRSGRARLAEEWVVSNIIEPASTLSGYQKMTNADRSIARRIWQGVRRVLHKAGIVHKYNEFELNELANSFYQGVRKGGGIGVGEDGQRFSAERNDEEQQGGDKQRISDILRRASENPLKRIHPIFAGTVDSRISKILDDLGMPIREGTVHYISPERIQHAKKNHPDLTEEDFGRIPDIIHDPTFIGISKNKEGLKRVWYLKQKDGDMLYLAVYGEQKERMVMRGFYKEKAGIIEKDLKQKGVRLVVAAKSTVAPEGDLEGKPSRTSVTPTDNIPQQTTDSKSDISHSTFRAPVQKEDIPQPVALPELTQLATDMLGAAPEIRERIRVHSGRANGVFHYREGDGAAGKIGLRADIFIGPSIAARRTRELADSQTIDEFRNEVIAATGMNPDDLVIRRQKNGSTFGLVAYHRDHGFAGKVLAHEIGHAADWLQDKTLKRGNLLGHIAQLHRYLSGSMGENAPGNTISSEARAELSKEAEKSVRQTMKSTDPDYKSAVLKQFRKMLSERKLYDNNEIKQELKELTHWWKPFDAEENPKYTAYRYRSAELYADALSVMFNSPESLAERAPNFMAAFRDFAGRRPEVKAQLDAIQQQIAMDNTPEARLARERQAMAMDEKRRAEIAGERGDKESAITGLGKQLAWALWDNHVYLPESARKAMMDVSYSGANATQYFRDVDAQTLTVLRKAGVDIGDFGVFVKNRRAAGERADMANPGGIRGEDAAQCSTTGTVFLNLERRLPVTDILRSRG